MKKILTSILTILAISTNAFAAQGDADALAGLIFAAIGLIFFGLAAAIALKCFAFILVGLIIAIAAVINTVIMLPIIFLVNKISGKCYEYFSFTKRTASKMTEEINNFCEQF